MLSVTEQNMYLSQQDWRVTNNSLRKIHTQISQFSFAGNFVTGWRTHTSSSSYCCLPCIDKVILVVMGILILLFVGASWFFGTLALKQAVEDIDSEGHAPIIGHFSEWSMQGVLCLSFYGQKLYDFALLGRHTRIHQVFMQALAKKRFTDEQRSILYDDYLRTLDNCQPTAWITMRNFPRPPELSTSLEDNLNTDQCLRETYETLEDKIAHFSYFKQLRQGWSVISAEKGKCHLALIKSALFAGGMFGVCHLLNYALGIVWSAQQSYEDYDNGENPSIGGHSLEWSVESLVLFNTLLYICREIANVGWTKMLTDLFYETIQALGTRASNRDTSRLFYMVRGAIEKTPRGTFFNYPPQLLFRRIEEPEVET